MIGDGGFTSPSQSNKWLRRNRKFFPKSLITLCSYLNLHIFLFFLCRFVLTFFVLIFFMNVFFIFEDYSIVPKNYLKSKYLSLLNLRNVFL